MSKMDSSQISVVIQGAISGKNKYSSEKGVTYDCIESLKKVLPNAEIILSTWKGANTKGLNYDKLVLNEDPGGYAFTTTDKLNNNNRLIVSTQGGLNIAKRKYCLKLRSDILLVSDNFLNFFDEFPKRTEKYNLFNHKVIGSSLFTYKFFKVGKKFMFTPFHPGDWLFFGLTEDLKTLFNIPLAEEPALSQHYTFTKRPTNRADFYLDCHWAYPPEQYIFYNALKLKFPELKLKDKTDTNYTNIKQSEHAMPK